MNPFNTDLGAPASGYGRVGSAGKPVFAIHSFLNKVRFFLVQFGHFFSSISTGFVTYSDVCWFDRNNYLATKIFDTETCSPYIYAIDEWISYEDERSISCKTNYVKENGFGGVMIFSLNTDDYSSYCDYGHTKESIDPSRFPLTRLINSILL